MFFLFFSHISADEKKFKEKRSTHFIVFYKADVDVDFVNDIIESAEDYYEEIADDLGFRRYKFWLWDERATIYVFAERESYLRETKQPEWSGGCADYRNKKLWTYPHAQGFFDSILPHELGHIIFRELVGFGSNIPLWLDEGVASYQEKSKRYAAKMMVRELIEQGALLSMQEMQGINSPHDIGKDRTDAFYTQSVSIVYFLIHKFHEDRFVTLCRKLERKMPFEDALDATYFQFKSSQDLYRQWLKYINEEG